MNEKERTLRKKLTPLLRGLAESCRENESAFVVIIEVEPGKMIKVSYLPQGTELKYSMVLDQRSQTVGNSNMPIAIPCQPES